MLFDNSEVFYAVYNEWVDCPEDIVDEVVNMNIYDIVIEYVAKPADCQLPNVHVFETDGEVIELGIDEDVDHNDCRAFACNTSVVTRGMYYAHLRNATFVCYTDEAGGGHMYSDDANYNILHIKKDYSRGKIEIEHGSLDSTKILTFICDGHLVIVHELSEYTGSTSESKTCVITRFGCMQLPRDTEYEFAVMPTGVLKCEPLHTVFIG